MNWTAEQAKAIELRGKNLLVAAAAGSGKTAVLVERIKRLILEDRCPIDRMLIVTFTNAAASEMKEKIEKALNSAISEAGSIISQKGGTVGKDASEVTKAGEDLVFLKKQLDLLPTANISTFHSFALEVIRRYFYIINIEPNFKICDESQQAILKGKAMDALFEKYYDENQPEFYEFLKKYSGDRNDNKLRDMIEKIFDTMQSLPEPHSWLKGAVESLNCDENEFVQSKPVRYLIEDFKDNIKQAAVFMEETLNLAQMHKLEGVAELAKQDMLKAEKLIEVAETEDFDDIMAELSVFKLPTAAKKYFEPKNNGDIDVTILEEAKEILKNNREPIKKHVDKAKKEIFYAPLAEMYAQVRDTYEDGIFFKKLIEDFAELYMAEKEEKGLADFNDIEHFAYRILKDEEAAGFYREKFEHIFIDEYQDSNVIQEALIGRICRENNLFMVGDVKQSIYKFRLAEPEIFQGKYRAYAEEMDGSGSNSISEKIDLNQNFRSKKPVIDFINRIFEKSMADYDDKAALYVGDPNGDKSTWQPKLFLAQTSWDDTLKLDDELKALIKAEKEALAAASIIRDYLGKPFFDSKKGVERPLEKKDIVILMRGIKNYGDVFYRILSENNLPAYVDDNDGYFDTIEINTFMAMLAIIDNEKQDIPLLTVMRSEILRFSIQELVDIRVEHKDGSYHDALVCYADKGSNEGLRNKCANTIKTFEAWRNMNRLLPLEELVWELLLSTGFYIAMGAMPAGSQRQANLRALVDRALAYRNTQDGSLYGFMNYIDAVKKRKVQMGQVKMVGEEDDTIRIMTIHKSKGLEFPMVLLAGFCRKLTYTSVGKGAVIHKDLGLGLPQVNYQENWFRTTLIQTAIKNRIHKEEVEEQKRVIYVALTRARDVLAILGIDDDVTETVMKVADNFPKDSSYMMMVGRTICNTPGTVKIVSDSSLAGLASSRKRTVSKALDLIRQPAGKIKKEVENRLTFRYPFENEMSIKSKHSVSELVRKNASEADTVMTFDEIDLAEPESFKGKGNLSAAQIGTITHKVLEKTDFAEASKNICYIYNCEPSQRGINTDYFDKLLQQMVCEEFLAEEEAAVVDTELLAKFVLSPLGKRISSSVGVYKERPFNAVMEVEGVSTMVQGVIDCYFIEDDKLVLVDYKTTNIKTKEEFIKRRDEIAKRYELQMKIYRKALEDSIGVQVKESLIYLTNIGEVIEC